MHPGVRRYREEERAHLVRYVAGKALTKDQLMETLRRLAEEHGVLGFIDLHEEWCKDGYVLPWEREPQGNGAAGQTAGQGGTR